MSGGDGCGLRAAPVRASRRVSLLVIWEIEKAISLAKKQVRLEWSGRSSGGRPRPGRHG